MSLYISSISPSVFLSLRVSLSLSKQHRVPAILSKASKHQDISLFISSPSFFLYLYVSLLTVSRLPASPPEPSALRQKVHLCLYLISTFLSISLCITFSQQTVSRPPASPPKPAASRHEVHLSHPPPLSASRHEEHLPHLPSLQHPERSCLHTLGRSRGKRWRGCFPILYIFRRGSQRLLRVNYVIFVVRLFLVVFGGLVEGKRGQICTSGLPYGCPFFFFPLP